jgi:hypothetical protein
MIAVPYVSTQSTEIGDDINTTMCSTLSCIYYILKNTTDMHEFLQVRPRNTTLWVPGQEIQWPSFLTRQQPPTLPPLTPPPLMPPPPPPPLPPLQPPVAKTKKTKGKKAKAKKQKRPRERPEVASEPTST